MKRVSKRVIVLALVMAFSIGTVQMPAYAAQPDDIVSIAVAETGNTNGSKYTFGAGNVAWCAYFVSWCARQAGISTSVIPTNGNCDQLYSGLVNSCGATVVSSPVKGDLIFYRSHTAGSTFQHVGIMTSSGLSVQGNLGGKVVNNLAPTGYWYSEYGPAATANDIVYVRPKYPSPTPPTNPTINISKTTVTTGENVTFTVGATNATGYTLGIDKGTVRVDTPNIGGNKTYTRSFSEPGSYSAYVTAYNSVGYKDSARVYFTVVSPDSILPSGSWISPKTGSTMKSSGSTTLSVDAADNSNMSKVTFHAYYDNAWHDIGQDSHGGNGTYSLTWNYNIFPQSVLIHAHLYDAAGNYKNIEGPTILMVLGTPTGFTAASGGYESIQLKWSASPGAGGYRIYRASSSSGTYSFVKEVTGTSYVNTGLAIGKSYYYKIRACVTSGTATKYSSYTSIVSGKPTLSTPAGFKAASSGYDRAGLSWTAVPGAMGYRIYKATTIDGTYSYVKSSAGTTATITGLTSGKGYFFKVRAYRTVGTTNWFSAYTKKVSVTPIPSTPASLKISSTTYDSIGTSWPMVTGASGYVLYQASSSGGTYSKIASTTGTSYTKTGLSAGTTYYYKVRAYRIVGTTKVYGNCSTVVSGFPSYEVISRNYNVISRMSTNRYLNGYSDAATGFLWKMVTCPPDGSTEQMLTFTRQPDGSYKINIVRYNKLMTIEGSVAAGSKLISSADSGSTSQRFVITRKDGEYYTISPFGRPDLVLSSTTIRTYTNTEHYLVQLETFNGGMNQYWKLAGV